MKSPAQNPPKVGPVLYRATPLRSIAARRHQQQRIRRQRLTILGLVVVALFVLLGVTVWGVCQAASQLMPLSALLKPGDTQAFEAYMDKTFNLSAPTSLLYYENRNQALAMNVPPVDFAGKLLPLMPVGEDETLKTQLESLFGEYPAGRFTPHLYFYDPQTQRSVEINGYAPVSAASVIKLPILLNYMLSLDEKLIQQDTPLLYADFHRAGGAGELQYRPAGVEFPAEDVAGQMIRISDNTCTNMMISYLGGTDAVNRRLAELGLVHTRIRNWLPDLTGTNTITPYEMVTILFNVDNGPLLSALSREDGLRILESTHNRRLLVAPLPKEAKVAHKTGDIGTAIGDSGIIYLPDGRKYFVSVQVERPFNDYTARDMVQRASRLIYNHVSAEKPTLSLTGNLVSQPVQAPSAL